MSRIARIVAEGVAYNVTQRGNGRQQVFFEDRDYQLYLDLVRASCEEAGLRVWAYCLMPNHVHLIVVPERATAMAQAMGRTNADYARYYNLSHRTCGHVWQARYFSTPLEDAHLWAMVYVERNPVRARMVAQAEEFAWSSARARRTGKSGMVDWAAWRAAYNWPRWREVLETSIGEEAFGERLQEASRRGRPLGGEEFTEELEPYSGTSTTVTDQAGSKRLISVDGLGRLVSVTEYPFSGTTYSTSYTYDVLDDLVGVNQSGQGRVFAYDSRKRLIASTNPETYSSSNSPALGCAGGVYTNCYYYDNNGNLIKKTDNRGVGTAFAYDSLNRLKTKTYFNLPLTVNYTGVQYGYDGSGVNYSRGRLTSVSNFTQAGAVISTTNYRQYDALGRI